MSFHRSKAASRHRSSPAQTRSGARPIALRLLVRCANRFAKSITPAGRARHRFDLAEIHRATLKSKVAPGVRYSAPNRRPLPFCSRAPVIPD